MTNDETIVKQENIDTNSLTLKIITAASPKMHKVKTKEHVIS